MNDTIGNGGVGSLQYVFTPESQLPADVGFSLFGPSHLLVLFLIGLLSAVVILPGCRMRPENRQRLLKVMSASMIALEVLKDLTLGAMGVFSLGYLPLHLCSMAMFLCLFFAWHPDSPAAGELVWGVCFSGGLAALLFPDWTNMPLYHFQSIHSFLYHALLIQFSLIAVISGMARPRLRHLWRTMVFLVLAAAVVYPLNLLLRTNYMFLNHPLSGTPLALCARLPGRAGYLLGYALLAGLVLALLDLPFALISGLKRHLKAKGNM